MKYLYNIEDDFSDVFLNTQDRWSDINIFYENIQKLLCGYISSKKADKIDVLLEIGASPYDTNMTWKDQPLNFLLKCDGYFYKPSEFLLYYYNIFYKKIRERYKIYETTDIFIGILTNKPKNKTLIEATLYYKLLPDMRRILSDKTEKEKNVEKEINHIKRIKKALIWRSWNEGI